MRLLLLLLATPAARASFVARAAADLPANRVLVRVADAFSEAGAVLTIPSDPNAEILAREPPLVEADGVTTLVTYFSVSAADVGAVEYRVEGSQVVGSRALTLVPLGRRRAARADPEAVW